MPTALLSRFDLVFILLDRPDEHHDRLVSEHIMRTHAAAAGSNTNHNTNTNTSNNRQSHGHGNSGGGGSLGGMIVDDVGVGGTHGNIGTLSYTNLPNPNLT